MKDWFTLWPTWCHQQQRHSKPKRWIVLDVETSGLDTHADQLLSVAALAIHISPKGPGLCFADSFDVVLQQVDCLSTPENVLLHKIGWAQQQSGVPVEQALRQLVTWVGDSPVVAFHAEFDRHFITKTMNQYEGMQIEWYWLDLAKLLPATFESIQAESLDDWMQALGVSCAQRHQAAADVWATAQLVLIAWGHWCKRGLQTLPQLKNLERQNRWLEKLRTQGL